MVKFGVVRDPSSDHSGLGSMPKLNFSVIVTPACAADTETEVLVARGAPERGLPPLVGQVSVGCGRVFLQVLVVLGATDHAEVVASGNQGTFGVVLSHTLEFVPATFGQPPAEFLGVVLAMTVPVARTPSSFFSRWKSTKEL